MLGPTTACCFVLGLELGLHLVSCWLVVMHTYLYYTLRCQCHFPNDITAPHLHCTAFSSARVHHRFTACRRMAAPISTTYIDRRCTVTAVPHEWSLQHSTWAAAAADTAAAASPLCGIQPSQRVTTCCLWRSGVGLAYIVLSDSPRYMLVVYLHFCGVYHVTELRWCHSDSRCDRAGKSPGLDFTVGLYIVLARYSDHFNWRKIGTRPVVGANFNHKRIC